MNSCSLCFKSPCIPSGRKLRRVLFVIVAFSLFLCVLLWNHALSNTRTRNEAIMDSRNFKEETEGYSASSDATRRSTTSTGNVPWTGQNGGENPSKFTGVVEPRALIFYSANSRVYKLLSRTLQSLRMEIHGFQTSSSQALFPTLVKIDHGRKIAQFSHVFLTGLRCFSNLNTSLQLSLRNYLSFSGAVTVTLYDEESDGNLKIEDLKSLSLTYVPYQPAISLDEVTIQMKVSPASALSRPTLSKAATVVHRIAHGRRIYLQNENRSISVVDVCVLTPSDKLRMKMENPELSQVLDKDNCADFGSGVTFDDGSNDGVKKVIVSLDLSLFPLPLLLYDIVVGLSPIPILPYNHLRRYIIIDVDDVFHATPGHQLNKQHVLNVLRFQEDVQENYIRNFRLNLGFVGSLFDSAQPEELEGNHMLVQHKKQFSWFPHTFTHTKPHQKTLQELQQDMMRNRDFAEAHGLVDMVEGYAVAPYHSGVYPIHRPLYQAWREVWNVSVTSTEEYPRLYPPQNRRGFVYQGLRILPRQTCGIFTSHTFFSDNKSVDTIRKIAENDVFSTILYNPISIFMTHFNNYGGDQLAILLFSHLFHFVSKFTNLELVQEPPTKLASLYFTWFPQETTPLWTSPCDYDRHRSIWSSEKNCTRFPSLIILGPQKTGSSALHFFLQAHPLLVANRPTKHFEEIQFFSSNEEYYKGIEWYMDQFPNPRNGNVILFEKSANYFDNKMAPQRTFSLLPRAKIVCILSDPVRRAYSWYQHVLAHGSVVAKENPFIKVLKYSGRDHEIISLRQRCLEPGLHSKHLQHWSKYYPLSQLFVADGGELVENPAKVLTKVQTFLQTKIEVDFSTLLSFDDQKGFYCRRMTPHQVKCLGSGKGRGYSDMTADERNFLENYYRSHNRELSTWLHRHGYQQPKWLVKYLEQ